MKKVGELKEKVIKVFGLSYEAGYCSKERRCSYAKKIFFKI